MNDFIKNSRLLKTIFNTHIAIRIVGILSQVFLITIFLTTQTIVNLYIVSITTHAVSTQLLINTYSLKAKLLTPRTIIKDGEDLEKTKNLLSPTKELIHIWCWGTGLLILLTVMFVLGADVILPALSASSSLDVPQGLFLLSLVIYLPLDALFLSIYINKRAAFIATQSD